MGETRVDLLHLLEDLRDAYPGALEETILTEVVANALDSGAHRIRLSADPATSIFSIIDDGSGMLRRELARYHDIATSTKTRGQGIGFAGVGIKLGLLICEHVRTETRRGKTHVASHWHLASRHKAPWKWIPPDGLVSTRGTAVQLRLTNPLSPLLDAGFIESALRRHFIPLLDPEFGELLSASYGDVPRFEINGVTLPPEPRLNGEVAHIEVKLARKRKPSAIGFMVRSPVSLAEGQCGLAISTLGKVIKRGWDWLGVSPAHPDRVEGLIEVPALAECLTLNKADFIRTGSRGATYLTYRKAIQELVSRQLAKWGDGRETDEDARRRAARPVERDLERVLVDLADDYPLISALVERHQGGQRRLLVTGPAGDDALGLVGGSLPRIAQARGSSTPEEIPGRGEPSSPQDSQEPPRTRDPEAASDSAGLGAKSAARRPTRYGLQIQFDRREGDREIARLVDSTIWINEAHAAYGRALASRSEGYHVALGVAMALAPLAAEPSHERAFVTNFLQRWGEALGERVKRVQGHRR
jgi:hypothetical protein